MHTASGKSLYDVRFGWFYCCVILFIVFDFFEVYVFTFVRTEYLMSSLVRFALSGIVTFFIGRTVVFPNILR